MKNYKVTAIIWKENKEFVSKCPELGVASCGSTIHEAMDNLKEAVELYLENVNLLGIFKDVEPALKQQEKFTSTFEVAV